MPLQLREHTVGLLLRRKKVIMMPHVYPPSISTVTRSDLANTPGYYRRLSNSFGYLNKQARQCRIPLLQTFHPEVHLTPCKSLVSVCPWLSLSHTLPPRGSLHLGQHGQTSHVLRAMQGYCYGGTCQKFPVIFGEFGSRMRDCRNRCAVAGCMPLELSVSTAADPAVLSPPYLIWLAAGQTGHTCEDIEQSKSSALQTSSL
jgi:hypothetical protein